MQSQLDRIATPDNFLTQLQELAAQVKAIQRYFESEEYSDPDLSPYLTTTTHAAITGDGHVPAGVIVMWSGSAGAIPSGWVLCDGGNGTPDLRDRFVVGAGSGYAVDDTGGEASHTLTTSEMPSHQHSVNPPSTESDTDGAHGHNYRKATGSGASDALEVNKSYTTGSVAISGGAHSHTVNIAAFDSAAAGGGAAHENRPPYYALCFIMKT